MILFKGDKPHLEQNLIGLLVGSSLVSQLNGWLVGLLLCFLAYSSMSTGHFEQDGTTMLKKFDNQG